MLDSFQFHGDFKRDFGNYFLFQHLFLPPLFTDAIIVTNLEQYLDAILPLASTFLMLQHLLLQPIGTDATILTNHEHYLVAISFLASK